MRFARVSKFWTDYIDVYNGYKHGLTAIPGSVVLEKEPLSIIMVRRKYRQKVCTYHIPVSLETIAYYEQIISDAVRGVLCSITMERRIEANSA
jgi:hypothetical protein